MLHASAYYAWLESAAVAKRLLSSSLDGHHHMSVLCCRSAIFYFAYRPAGQTPFGRHVGGVHGLRGIALMGGLGRPRPFCMCALQVSFPRLTAPFASAHLSGLCASRWSGERILMTLTISTTNPPHRLCSHFLPLNSNMYLKARETMSGTTRIPWATLSLCLHLWDNRACHHVPLKSNACFIQFYTELRDHESVSGLLARAETWRNCIEKDRSKKTTKLYWMELQRRTHKRQEKLSLEHGETHKGCECDKADEALGTRHLCNC